MSFLKRKINFKDLEEELQSAVKADDLYKLQNDAKLRAVEQNVPNYEQFRQMVKAAHLKPMDRKKNVKDSSWQLKDFEGRTDEKYEK
ncbi:coiled-coil domain-containing protein 103 [Fopius arisanus]|uniref:Coiled-coil domain-containing protein 103 n=1 Tax=Fopius arisanus TaxID=64838 RepID=A0A9R1U6D5_9HYME|nr:PREDICTED: coiled-coil domain-containing protein 103 [Fopius arisanus]